MTHQTQTPTLPSFIWAFLKDYKKVSFLYVFLALIAGLCTPFNGLLVKKLVNALPHTSLSELSKLYTISVFLVLNFIIFDNLTWRSMTYLRLRYMPYILKSIISEMLKECLDKSNAFFQENFSGKISKQMTNLADGIEKILTSITQNFLRAFSLMIASMVTVYFVNPFFCVIFVIWFVLFVGSSIIMSKKGIAYKRLWDAQVGGFLGDDQADI